MRRNYLPLILLCGALVGLVLLVRDARAGVTLIPGKHVVFAPAYTHHQGIDWLSGKAALLINMVLALIVLPLLVWLVKPGFVRRKDLFVGEGVDLSQYTLTDKDLDSDMVAATA